MGFIMVPDHEKQIAVDACAIVTIAQSDASVLLTLSTGRTLALFFEEEVKLEGLAMAVERCKHLTSLTSWDAFSKQVLEKPQY